MVRSFAIISCLALAITVLLLNPNEVDGRCKRQYLRPYVATPADTVIPIDGGAVLVGLTARSDGKKNMSSLPDTFTIVKDDEKIVLKTKPLAPGFARLIPEEKPSAGTWTVKDVLQQTPNANGGYDEATVTFGDVPLGDVPAPPEVESGTLTRKIWGRGRRRVVVKARLTAPVPDDALYVLSSWSEEPDLFKGGTRRVAVEDDVLEIFRNRGRCTSSPDGESAPADGSKAVIRWVNGYGQVSAPSTPFEITEVEASD